MELVSLYSFDPTGRATANKVENQSIVVTPPSQVTDYSYVVPRGAPFYADTLVVKDGRTPGARTLVENVDYWCVIDFLSASVTLTRRVCVGIALLDPGYSGTLYVSYQALGGNYTMADYSVLEELIRERYVVKHVSYEQVVNLPAGFAPEWHTHEVDDMVGMSSVVDALGDIRDAAAGRNGSYSQIEQQLRNHINSSNAHTPADVGLDKVKNYGVATLTDVAGGASNKYITGDVLKSYVNSAEIDISHLATKSDVQNTYATKSSLNNYYPKATSDGRYAYKSDTYDKSTIDNMLANMSFGDELTGFYSKQESDARYLPKSDITQYIKTTVADGRYASNSDLNNYYSKTESNSRYASKSASYTKSESNGRYLTSSDLSPYLTENDASSTYQPKTSMSNYYTKSEVDRINTKVEFVSDPHGDANADSYFIKYLNRDANGNLTVREDRVELKKHVLKKDVYTKDEVDNAVSNGQSKVWQKKWYRTTNYRSYKLPTAYLLKYVQSTGVVYLTATVTTGFYYNEEALFTVDTGAAQDSGSGTVQFDLLSFSAEIITSTISSDAWVRPTRNTLTCLADGTLEMPLHFNVESSGNSYVNNFQVLISFNIDSLSDHQRIMQWFNSNHIVDTNW